MDTPIRDFAQRYADRRTLRLHMPGHKGQPVLGPEPLDITEIDGADVLYHARGIIRQSEAHAAALFGTARTLYSTEGSSLSIRAMLYLALLYAKAQGRGAKILASRNAHKTFMTAAALLDLEVSWLYPPSGENLLSCPLRPQELEQCLSSMEEKPIGVYLTSPDYLGNRLELRPLAELCRKYGVLLLVDNAHGAYLHFLPEPCHPMDLGADLCCDSAHKTLPVLTGGAYLHISKDAPSFFSEQAESAMAMFASTSPSYLILQSLDLANAYLASDYSRRLSDFADRVQALKERLRRRGFPLVGREPLKLTVAPKAYGYTGTELAQRLEGSDMICEFSDPDHTVLMLTPEQGEEGLEILEQALLSVEKRSPILTQAPPVFPSEKKCSLRQALFSPSCELPLGQCEGKILANASITCPPAVPIVLCGEEITDQAIRSMEYYGISTCRVLL